MTGKLFIDNGDAWTLYGIRVAEDGYNELLAFAPLKSVDANDWGEQDGVEADLSAPALDTKELSIKFLQRGSRGDSFYELLSDMSYHDFNFVEIGRRYRLRLVAQPDLKNLAGLSVFSLRFADDFPFADNYTYQPPLSTVATPPTGYKLDNVDFAEYGISILRGTQTGLDRLPATKRNLLRSFQRENGAEYDGEEVMYQTKEAKIYCLMQANSMAEFWRNYDALLYRLFQPGERKYNQYPCYYKTCNTVNFKPDGKIWFEFEITVLITGGYRNQIKEFLEYTDFVCNIRQAIYPDVPYYLVYSLEDWFAMNQLTSPSHLWMIILMADLDFEGVDLVPANVWRGLYGMGHTIKNITIKDKAFITCPANIDQNPGSFCRDITFKNIDCVDSPGTTFLIHFIATNSKITNCIFEDIRLTATVGNKALIRLDQVFVVNHCVFRDIILENNVFVFLKQATGGGYLLKGTNCVFENIQSNKTDGHSRQYYDLFRYCLFKNYLITGNSNSFYVFSLYDTSTQLSVAINANMPNYNQNTRLFYGYSVDNYFAGFNAEHLINSANRITDEQARDRSFYRGIGWDFNTEWKMGDDGYPALQDMPAKVIDVFTGIAYATKLVYKKMYGMQVLDRKEIITYKSVPDSPNMILSNWIRNSPSLVVGTFLPAIRNTMKTVLGVSQLPEEKNEIVKTDVEMCPVITS